MPVIQVPSKIRPYTVQFSETWSFLEELDKSGDTFWVIDHQIWSLYGQKIPYLNQLKDSQRLIFQSHEDQKTLDGVAKIYDALIQRTSKKNMTLIAMGGGILQDVVGFAASTLYRGIRWVYIPTTLLAQSDSCIGGKTSLNYKGYKNLLGTFYPPHEIYIVPSVLNTLPEVDYFSGLGEVVKLHLLDGREKTSWYLNHEKAIALRSPVELRQSIVNSLEIKTGYLAEDEFDQGRRNLLNYGHCYGHALESVSQFAVPHGQAVLMGMIFSNIVARLRGLQSPTFEQAMAHLIGRHVVMEATEFFKADPILDAMRKDKKRTGRGIALILMSDQHETTRVGDLTESEFQTANAELTEHLNAYRTAPASEPSSL